MLQRLTLQRSLALRLLHSALRGRQQQHKAPMVSCSLFLTCWVFWMDLCKIRLDATFSASVSSYLYIVVSNNLHVTLERFFEIQSYCFSGGQGPEVQSTKQRRSQTSARPFTCQVLVFLKSFVHFNVCRQFFRLQ